MPSTNTGMRSTQKGSAALTILVLDTGNSNSFTKIQKTNRNYGLPIASQRWSQIYVNSPDFVSSQPCAGMQIGPSDMLIFGGESTQVFTFDTREVASSTKIATVALSRGALSTTARFGVQSDFCARQFKNFIYAIDPIERQLHVHMIKEQAWQSQGLDELGIE